MRLTGYSIAFCGSPSPCCMSENMLHSAMNNAATSGPITMPLIPPNRNISQLLVLRFPDGWNDGKGGKRSFLPLDGSQSLNHEGLTHPHYPHSG